jgi:hypothetical protein
LLGTAGAQLIQQFALFRRRHKRPAGNFITPPQAAPASAADQIYLTDTNTS